MKRFAAVITAAWLAVCAGAAHAATDYSASLKMENGLPALRTGSPNFDGPNTLNGEWTTYSDPRGSAFTRDQGGTWQGNSDMHRSGGAPNGMGEAHGNAYLLDGNSSASGSTYHRSVGASGHVNTLGQSDIAASGVWSRGFALDAHSAFTFTGLATLSVTGDDAPLNLSSLFTIDPLASFASLVLGDIGNRVRTEMTAALTSVFSGDLSNVFSYSIGPNGLLSLTITNNTDTRMTGQLGAGAYVNVSAPVPEPATVALMLAGVGLVGAATRRRAAKGAAA